MISAKEVNQRTDIVSLVSEHVSLDTRSRNPKACCPFHSEKTPSFVLYPQEGRWHCFGSCSEGGTAIDFLMKKEKMEFKEALVRLAERAGISLGSLKGASTSDGQQKPNANIFAVNKIAADWFAGILSSGAGAEARAYLAERGLDSEAIKRHSIGFAPDGNLTLLGHLKSKQVDSKLATAASLVVSTLEHGWKDFFRNRIMFPIKDVKGRIVGFGGRALGDGNPKYINTPSTDVFDKAATLYGIDAAHKHIRATNRVVVVEGYMDAITAHEYGFGNVVASMGVAITDAQRNVLSRMLTGSDKSDGEIILCLDADAAGTQATVRALETMIAETNGKIINSGPVIKIASQVEGKDPDEAIRLLPLAWKESLDNAVTFSEYLFESLKTRFDLDNPNGKADAASSVAPIVLASSNSYQQDRLLSRLAAVLNVTEGQVTSLIQTVNSRNPEVRTSWKKGQRGPDQVSSEQVAALLSTDPKTAIEDHLLALLLRYPSTRQIAENEPIDLFADNLNRAIFEVWLKSGSEEDGDLPIDVQEKISVLRNKKFPPGDEVKRLQSVRQCINRLWERNIKFQVEQVGSQLAETQRKGESDNLTELLEEAAKKGKNLRRIFAAERQGTM